MEYKLKNGSVISFLYETGNKINGLTEHYAECSKCSLDPEIFPDGQIKLTTRNLRLENCPHCLCSDSPRLEDWQIMKLTRRLLDVEVVSVTGGKFKHVNVISGCGEFSIRFERVLKGVAPKGVFTKRKISEVNREVIETDYFPAGSKFTPDYERGGSYWIYHCPICIEDNFSKSGLCNGMFSSRLDTLKTGRLPCRCSEKPKLTSDQKLLVVRNEAARRGAELKEVDLSGSQKSIKIPFICRNGHENNMRYDAFIKGNCCLECSRIDNPYSYYPHRKEEEDNLYIFKSTRCEDLTKIGRTFNISTRVNHFPKDYRFELLGIFQGRHEDIYDLEQKLLKKLKRFSYEPSIDFHGKSECFTPEILNHPEVISIFNLEDNL